MPRQSLPRVFSDPDENILADLFSGGPESSPKVKKQILSILQHNPSWTMKIHLSEQRHALVDWIPLVPNKRMLEVGAGCGALTASFLKKKLRVTSLEPSPQRASILSHRFFKTARHSVLNQDLASLDPTLKFDYISTVGVLEYAGVFHDSQSTFYKESVFVSFLSKIRSHLSQQGWLILAIENQLGLKYLLGNPEDHYSTAFEGINGYPHYSGVKTFGKTHLSNLLANAGFQHQVWRYPFPDYKLPTQILSDQYLHDITNQTPVSTFLPSILSKKSDISEVSIAGILINNHLLGHFANSFLVLAQNQG